MGGKKEGEMRKAVTRAGEAFCRQYSTTSAASKRITLIRHGQTESNVWMNQPGQRWGDKGFTDAGMYDTRLTATGEQQARTLNNHLKTEPPPQLLVVSPLTR